MEQKRKMLKTLLGINNNNHVTRATAYLNKINSSFAEVELTLHTMETQYIEWGVEYPKLPAWILKPKDPHLYPESYKFNCHYQLISSWVADPISILSTPIHEIEAVLQYAIFVKYRKNILNEFKLATLPRYDAHI